MNRAHPAQLRGAGEIAQTFIKHGILFVCIPVLDDQDHIDLARQSEERLERLARIAEAEERAGQPAGESV